MSRSWPVPTRAAHQKFVEIEGWTDKRSARGKETDHHRYELSVGDDILRTRISRPASSKETYGPKRWAHILRDQLKVSEEEFWVCVENGVLPERSQSDAVVEPSAPPDVLYTLIHRARIPEEEVKAMSRQEAIDRLHQFYTEGR